MVFDEILERNRTFARGRTPVPFPETSAAKLAVVACYDPRIDVFLRDALALEAGSAFLLRAAGAYIAPAGDPIRSLAVAVYLFGIREILVVGHTSCRMAQFRASEFADAFRSRGVPREVFGEVDLRSWVGAIPDPRRGILASVGVLRATTVLPRDLQVTGVVLDDTTGALDVVIGAAESLPGTATTTWDSPTAAHVAPERETTVPVAPAASDIAKPATGTAPTHPFSTAAAPTQQSPAQPPAPAPHTNDAVQSALHLIATLRSKAGLRDEAMRLRLEMGATSNPFEKLRLVEAFLRRAGGDAKEVRTAVENLRRRAADTPPAAVADEIVRRVSDLARED